jgi:Mn2+/Fe2+ NRAMP family transporter
MENKKKNFVSRFFAKAKLKIKETFQILGPGFITGAADDDPSGIGTYSIAGAKYGPLLLWLVPFQLPLMYAIQNMCGRIGLVTGKGLAANMKIYFPKYLFYTAIVILCVANVINIGADISIMAASIKLVFGYNIHFWAIITTAFIVVVQIFIPYHTYSKILLGLSVFLFSYMITAFVTVDSWLEILYYTFTPHIQWNKDFLVVMAGFIGTTISPYLFFWQTSQEIEEKLDHKTKSEIKKIIDDMPKDTFMGMFFSQLMALFIVVTCYCALHKNGITEITSAYDAAIALKPFAGEAAYIVFSLGIIGAGLLGIPVLAGSTAYALSELFNKKEGLSYTFGEAKFFYSVIAVSTFLGLIINFIGINPITALLYAAVINCIAAVPLVLFVLILANKKELMGQYANGYFLNIMGCITFLVLLLSALPVLYYAY